MFWPLLLLVFIIQEPVSSSGVLFEAYQHGYSVWLIHLVFVAATLFDIAVGYTIGSFIQRRFWRFRLVAFIRRQAERFGFRYGSRGKRWALIIFAPVVFPLSAVLPPFLGVSFLEAVACLLLGELIFWYAVEWLLVFGISSFGFDPRYSLLLVIVTTALVFLGRRKIWRR